jgi:hypothetical protein
LDNRAQLSLPIPSESLLTQREREHALALRCLEPLMTFWSDGCQAGSPFRKQYADCADQATRLLKRWS